MKDKPVNQTTSIVARLRNVAREKNTDPQLILRRYAIERLLYRLSISSHQDRFVLKGAMLFTAWLEDRRKTALPEATSDGLSDDFARDPAKHSQWAAFVKREQLSIAAPGLEETIAEIKALAMPPAEAARTGEPMTLAWSDGGPWK